MYRLEGQKNEEGVLSSTFQRVWHPEVLFSKLFTQTPPRGVGVGVSLKAG